MNIQMTVSPTEGGGKGMGELKRILGQLADLEEQIAHKTKTAFLTNLDARKLICDQALILAADISLAACSAVGQGSALSPILSRGLAKGLFLGLREVGEDMYDGAYLTMRGMMAGAALCDADLYPIVLAGSRVILTTAEQHGADREEIIKKLASGAIEGGSASFSEAASIENLFLEMFELVGPAA
jgi:hypothetical protein